MKEGVMYERHMTGKEGEEIATEYLSKKGYKILNRNFNTKQGEKRLMKWNGKKYKNITY